MKRKDDSAQIKMQSKLKIHQQYKGENTDKYCTRICKQTKFICQTNQTSAGAFQKLVRNFLSVQLIMETFDITVQYLPRTLIMVLSITQKAIDCKKSWDLIVSHCKP